MSICFVNRGLQRLGMSGFYRTHSTSAPERELLSLLMNVYSGPIQHRVRDIVAGYELDILLPELGIGFEFNGMHWHSSKNKPMAYHMTKSWLYRQKGIFIYHVHELDWDIHNARIVSDIYRLVGYNISQPDAGDVKISYISSQEADVFIQRNQYHPQTATHYIGVSTNQTILSIIPVNVCDGEVIITTPMTRSGWDISNAIS